jgi:hypothetical protein
MACTNSGAPAVTVDAGKPGHYLAFSAKQADAAAYLASTEGRALSPQEALRIRYSGLDLSTCPSWS